jgi:hypothetical protein
LVSDALRSLIARIREVGRDYSQRHVATSRMELPRRDVSDEVRVRLSYRLQGIAVRESIDLSCVHVTLKHVPRNDPEAVVVAGADAGQNQCGVVRQATKE